MVKAGAGSSIGFGVETDWVLPSHPPTLPPSHLDRDPEGAGPPAPLLLLHMLQVEEVVGTVRLVLLLQGAIGIAPGGREA